MAQRQIHRSAGFENELKRLAKKHRELPAAVDAFLSLVATTDGKLPGDLIPGLNGQPVYKDRVAIGNRGKSHGARVIYYCAEQLVIPLAIYAKGDVENLPPDVILEALKAAGIMPADQNEQGV